MAVSSGCVGGSIVSAIIPGLSAPVTRTGLRTADEVITAANVERMTIRFKKDGTTRLEFGDRTRRDGKIIFESAEHVRD